jgi:hypothetical protein
LPVARFTADIPWTTAGFRQARVEASDPRLRVLGLRGRTLAILWVQNRAHTWWNVVQRIPIPPVEKAQITLSDLEPGRYRVEYWDTWTGTITRRLDVRVNNGVARLPLPSLERDLAIKLLR